MAVTTKKLFAATSNATTTVFSPVSIQLNNQDDLDVYVTLSGGTRVLQLRQSTGSTAQSSHPQVNNTDGLYFPAVSAGTTLYNYQLSTDNNTITFNSALPQGAVVFCERRTRDADSTYTSFASGSTIRATDLNNSSTESNFTAQDGRNKALEIEGAIWDGDQISSVYVTSANIVDGTIQTADIAADQITNALIADDQIDSEHIVADSLDTEHYAAGSVDNTALGADSVTSAKIADDQINSEHYVDGSIDTQHIADAQITHVKLANDSVDGDNIQDDSINSEHYASLSIDTEHIANENVTTAKLAADAVTSAKLADNAVVTANIVDANVTHVKLALDAVDGSNIQDSVINTEHYADTSIRREHIADGEIITAKIAADAVNGTKIADDSIDSEHYVDGSVDHQHLANDCVDADNIQANSVSDSEIVTGTLDNRYYTETELDAGQLDNRYYTETESDARYFNISTGDTIKDGDSFPDNDTTIATTAAINDRIIDLVDDVGGFVPIANETSFPNTNPDVNDGTGTIVSISTLASNHTSSGSGVITISNGTVGNSTVTINGAENSTTYSAGFGLLVETTTTLNTYTFHRLVPKATEVTTVAGISSNITTVANNTSNINAVAADASDIGVVAADGTDIGLVAGSISNVNTVAGDISNVNAVAGNATNINAVAGNATNINSAVSNASNINSAVSNASNINSAVSNASNITSVAGSISNVNTTAGSIANVNTTASNISNVNNFAEKYQIASSDPSTDGGGNALAEGDLYFNTTADELKVYNGGAWQGGVTASGNFATKTGNTFTGNNIHNDNIKSIYGTSSDGLEIFHNASDSVINDQGTGSLKLQTGGSTKIEVTSTGTSVTGNITVSGNVDGRDVAADGTKLDGIETSATADQTAAEIRTLVESASDSNVFTDADHSKLNAIEASATADQTASEIKTLLNSDGIVNANVDASAAIAGTKISPDFGSQNIATTGTLASNDITITGGQPALKLVDDANNPDYNIYNNNGLLKIRDTTNAADRLIIQGDGTVDIQGNLDANGGLDVTGNITVTGTVDGIDIATDVAANTAKTTNATHTGDVTGSTSLTIANDAVTGAKIADDSINSEHYVNGSIDTAHIANQQVTSDKLADNSVITAKINNGNVTEAKLASGSVTVNKIGSGAVATAAIADDAVTNAKISVGAVGTTEISNNAVTTAKIADGAITQAKFANGAIGAAAIGDDAVGSAELADNAVANSRIQDNAVSTAKIADDAVTTAKIADDAITTAQIGNNAVSSGQINDNAVGSNQITSDAVTTAKIADDAVTGSKINANAVGTTQLLDTSVTLAKLEHGTSSNDGKFLRANNGADPTFETVASAGQAHNTVINGEMLLAQRSTSDSFGSGGYKTMDRWETVCTSAGTWNQSQSNNRPSGFGKSLLMSCLATASLSSSTILTVRQSFEGQDIQHFRKGGGDAKAITVSFYVKTNKSGTYLVELYDTDNTKIATQSYTVSSGDTGWNRYSVTFPASTNTGQFNCDNGKSLMLSFLLATGSNFTSGTASGSFAQGSDANRGVGQTVNLADSTSNTWYLTGVQMEPGSDMNDYAHESFPDTVSKCERYYHQTQGNMFWMTNVNGSDHFKPIQFPTTMRSSPSVSFYNVTGDGGGGSASGSTPNGYQARLNGNGRHLSWAHKASAEL